MLNIAVCDDEAAAVAIVRRVLKDSFAARELKAEIATYTDAENLLKVIQAGGCYDILLLDIDMPGIDGVELGARLHDLMQNTILIYVSGRAERVFDSFRARPFRFVRKSVFREEWPGVMDDLERELERRRASRLVFMSGTQQIALRAEEIVYVEALRKKQALHTLRGEYDLSDSFENVASRLDGLGFIRIHRSYTVNYRFIYSLNRTEVELDDGSLLPIGRSKHAAVQQEFHRLVLSRL